MKTIGHSMWVGMAALLALESPAWGEPRVTDTEIVISECTGHCGVDSLPISVKALPEPNINLPVTAKREHNTKPEQTPLMARDAGLPE